MTSILNKEWRGVLALIWLLFGILVVWLLERLLDPLIQEYFVTLWMIGWFVSTSLLAISGIRAGNTASRLCALLVLLLLAAPVLFIIYAGFALHGH